MKQNLLEPLMLLSCERNIDINEDEAVNNYANTSKILKEKMLFKYNKNRFYNILIVCIKYEDLLYVVTLI